MDRKNSQDSVPKNARQWINVAHSRLYTIDRVHPAVYLRAVVYDVI